jgi:adenosylhomocysteine nucleosidase
MGAMQSEIAAIREAMDAVQVTVVAGMEFAAGTIDGTEVVVAQCGMGKVNAGICAQTLISGFGVGCVINTGVAGSLSDELTINDFVVSTDAVQHDFDVSPIGFARGEIPYTGLFAFPADEELRRQAVAAVRQAAPASMVLEGRVCSGDQFIATKEQTEAITSTFGGLCAEMEGAAIAQVCHLNQVPYVIIRAISDDSDDMTFEQFQAEAARECAGAVLAMVSARS